MDQKLEHINNVKCASVNTLPTCTWTATSTRNLISRHKGIVPVYHRIMLQRPGSIIFNTKEITLAVDRYYVYSGTIQFNILVAIIAMQNRLNALASAGI